MTDAQEQLLKLLSEVEMIINSCGQDTVAPSYSSIEEVNADLLKMKTRVLKGDKTIIHEINIAFLPTGAFQEISISSGWENHFLRIAEKMDKAMEEWQNN